MQVLTGHGEVVEVGEVEVGREAGEEGIQHNCAADGVGIVEGWERRWGGRFGGPAGEVDIDDHG